LGVVFSSSWSAFADHDEIGRFPCYFYACGAMAHHDDIAAVMRQNFERLVLPTESGKRRVSGHPPSKIRKIISER
jgi:hypothetical protein